MGLTPMELLAGALSACISIDILMILNKQKIEVKKYAVYLDAIKKIVFLALLRKFILL